MADLVRIFKEEIEPQLFPHLDKLLKKRQLSHPHGRFDIWISPYKNNGGEPHRPKPNKTTIADPRSKSYEHIKLAEWGEEPVTLIDAIMQDDRCSYVEAVRKCAREIGKEDLLSRSTYDDKEHAAWKEKQKNLEGLLKQMQDALYSPEGKEALDALHARGYSDEYIHANAIGYAGRQCPYFSALCSSLTYTDSVGKQHRPLYSDKLKAGVGYSHTIAIAYKADGAIRGYSFRSHLDNEGLQALKDRLKDERNWAGLDRYLTHFIGEKDTQKYYPFGLSTGKLSNYIETYPHIYIVEGALDALRGQWAGLANTIAVSQGNLTQAHAQAVKGKGAQVATIIFDTEELRKDGDDPEASRRANEDRTARAVKYLLAQGINTYIYRLPSHDGRKVDMDSYFKGYTDEEIKARGEELKATIQAEAQTAMAYLWQRERAKYPDTLGDDYKDALYRDTMHLLAQPSCTPNDKKKVLDMYSQATGIPLEMLKAEMGEAEEEIEHTIKTAQDALHTHIAEALEQFTTDPAQSAEAMKQSISEYDIAISNDMGEYTRIKTLAEEMEEERGSESGILVNTYKFYAEDIAEPLAMFLPARALSVVCAPSGHGKTRVLENIALRVAMGKGSGSVIFFSLEEEARMVRYQMLNIYHTWQELSKMERYRDKAGYLAQCDRIALSVNNLRQIEDYRGRGDEAAEYFRGKGAGLARLKDSEQKFYDDLINTGKLRILEDGSGDIDKISRAIRYITKINRAASPTEKPLKAIFIDYVQRIKKQGKWAGNRKEMLTAVMNDLINLAKEIDVPIVLAAQPNRQILSPLEMDIHDIADATEIEQGASVIYLGWNSKRPARAGNKLYSYTSGKETTLREDATRWEEYTGIHLGQRGDFYLYIAKNRKGTSEVKTRLYFDENSGMMVQGSLDGVEKRANAESLQKHIEEDTTPAARKAAKRVAERARSYGNTFAEMDKPQSTGRIDPILGDEIPDDLPF